MSSDLRTGLITLGYYRGETYYYDPNKPRVAWLQSDFAGAAFPVGDEERLALLDLIAGHDCLATEHQSLWMAVLDAPAHSPEVVAAEAAHRAFHERHPDYPRETPHE